MKASFLSFYSSDYSYLIKEMFESLRIGLSTTLSGDGSLVTLKRTFSDR
jgi:hypothetical protein